MSSVFLLIPLALGMFAVAACMFVWAVRNHQFDDLDSPASRILFDDEALHAAPLQQAAASPDQSQATGHGQREKPRGERR